MEILLEGNYCQNETEVTDFYWHFNCVINDLFHISMNELNK